MLSVASHMLGSSGNSRRRARLIGWGLHRSLSVTTMNSNSAVFSMIFIGCSLRRRTAAPLWAWKGRY